MPDGECSESGGVGRPIMPRGGEGVREKILRLSDMLSEESSSMSPKLKSMAPSLIMFWLSARTRPGGGLSFVALYGDSLLADTIQCVTSL